MKVWAVGGGGVGGSEDNRYGGSGAVAHRTWSVAGGQTVGMLIAQSVGNWQADAQSTIVAFAGFQITAQGARTPYGTGTTTRATFSGGDGGAQGSLGGTGASDGRGLNNDSGRSPNDVSGLLSAVALAASGGNVPGGVTTANFGFGNLVANRSSAPPAGGGGQAGGGGEGGDPSSAGAVVLYFT
jgi:hypothetical protein